ncbi:tetratricopeptide repeat protein [Pseudoduganella lurida]|uniref:Tetratricopeptide repeat protein n=1 Tax=Pseudoduganella lurida TaxID=1036180 RepID=A0A562R7U9_9BURK|nr:tetratricopeptide repeat protein [Pseudoduganella lurida]TWI64446.1 tetratricopeptide repeat protein [Pseudoduganella lurida]
MLKPLIAGIVLAAAASSPARASLEGNPASRALVQEGFTLQSQGRNKEAFEKYQQAASADPAASIPLSSMADLLYNLIEGAKPELRQQIREQASAAAHAALQKAANDPIAQEVLRKLEDEGAAPAYVPKGAAAKALSDAETAFAQRDYVAARRLYDAALAADPQYSAAWVGAADCAYMQQQWGEAERLFRQATAADPRNAQAWRFLSDALVQQGKRQDAEDALLAAIAAHPAQKPNWDKLGGLRKATGAPPLTVVNLSRVPRTSIKDGKPHIELAQGTLDNKDAADGAVWLALAVFDANPQNTRASVTPYARELERWRKALQVADEIAENGGPRLQDPSLLAMQDLYHRNQLDAGILFLRYREAYRADLDAWLAAHPHGTREFVATWSLRP